MKVDRITLREIRLPLVHFFETSFGRTTGRRILLIEAESGGVSGWGEVTCGESPYYNEEWTDAAWLLLKDFAIPRVLGQEFTSASAAGERTEQIRGHLMARGGLEAAIWDLEARQLGLPLWEHLGGARGFVPAGVSIGIQESVEQLLDLVAREAEAGYRRVKVKIKPGWDFDVIRRIREKFPDLPLMADANSSYRLSDLHRLKRLEEFDLMMIEQPLAHDDILDHAKLQNDLEIPVCLDESIRSARHAEQAIEIGAGRIINIKLGRVGGFAEAILVHNVARLHDIPVWCGGMLESGVGRAHNIALSTLDHFTLPGDVSASKRYWRRDIIHPAVEVSPDGLIEAPSGAGIGFDLDLDYIDHLTVRRETLA